MTLKTGRSGHHGLDGAAGQDLSAYAFDDDGTGRLTGGMDSDSVRTGLERSVQRARKRPRGPGRGHGGATMVDGADRQGRAAGLWRNWCTRWLDAASDVASEAGRPGLRHGLDDLPDVGSGAPEPWEEELAVDGRLHWLEPVCPRLPRDLL